jgi:hypothetical protein
LESPTTSNTTDEATGIVYTRRTLSSLVPPPCHVNDEGSRITIAGKEYSYSLLDMGEEETEEQVEGGGEAESSAVPGDAETSPAVVPKKEVLYRSYELPCLSSDGRTGFDIGIVMRRPNVYWVEEPGEGEEEIRGGGRRARRVMQWCVKEGSVRSRLVKSGEKHG